MDQVSLEMESLLITMARMESYIKLLVKTTSDMNPELRTSLLQLISDQFPSTKSLLEVIQKYIKQEQEIHIKIEDEDDDDHNLSDDELGFLTYDEASVIEQDELIPNSNSVAIPNNEFRRTTRNKKIIRPHDVKSEESGADDDAYYSPDTEPDDNLSDQEEYIPPAKVLKKSRPQKTRNVTKKNPAKKETDTINVNNGQNLKVKTNEIITNIILLEKLPKIKNPVVNTSTHLCPTCGKVFNKKDNLNKHVWAIHDKEVKFICTTCGKGFKWKDCLKLHEISAHAAKPKVICSQCGAWFKLLSGLKRHEKIVHQGVRAHLCSTCGKSFKQKTHLSYHQKTHENGGGGRQRGLNQERKMAKPVRCNFSQE